VNNLIEVNSGKTLRVCGDLNFVDFFVIIFLISYEYLYNQCSILLLVSDWEEQNMNINMFRKGLVIAIIFLFIVIPFEVSAIEKFEIQCMQSKTYFVTSFDGSDWSNFGGNAQRNGLSSVVGPTAPDIIWFGGRPSIIAWHPVTEGDRLFVVREADWPGTQDDSIVVCMNLSTGEELWTTEIPYHAGDWITWIAGVKNGRIFASRSGNGASVNDSLYALDVETGDTLWLSADLIDAGAYDGVVFASDGDPVIASFYDIWRIDAEDGATVWRSNRSGSVSGNCGGALYGNAFYVIDRIKGGQILVRYDVDTGQRMYQSPKMPGWWTQTSPMVGLDGTIYVNRVQNDPAVDFLYAWEDNGTGFSMKWHVPAAFNPSSELGVGPDGSIYTVIPGPKVARLDPVDGSVIDSYSYPPSQFLKSRFAIDSQGNVFFSNGGDELGHLYAFTFDLTLLWDVAIPNINIGGPALGKFGTLVVCGIGTNMIAYRTVGNNQRPTAPLINGPTNGKAGIEYDYTFTATDPDDDDVYYYIDWGDDTFEKWIGPYSSGKEVIVGHSWSKEGIYTIKARAKDIHGTIGDWGTLEVTMPRNKVAMNNQLIQKLLQHFSNVFPLLKQLLRL